jgi:hypothetical protein
MVQKNKPTPTVIVWKITVFHLGSRYFAVAVFSPSLQTVLGTSSECCSRLSTKTPSVTECCRTFLNSQLDVKKSDFFKTSKNRVKMSFQRLNKLREVNILLKKYLFPIFINKNKIKTLKTEMCEIKSFDPLPPTPPHTTINH